MIRLTTIAVLFLSAGCAQDHKHDVVPEVVTLNDVSVRAIDPFNITLQLSNEENGLNSLSVFLEMDSGCYVISPFSEDSFYGHFIMSFEENNHFVLVNPILEFPKSVLELDTILKEPVRFIRENTTFKQTLRSTSNGDFEVSGLVEFLLEPSCIAYDVTLIISSCNGEMSVVKTNTEISSEYLPPY
jgi:hypothetical protein